MDKSRMPPGQKWITSAMIAIVLSVLGTMAWAYLRQCDAWDCPNVERFVRSFGPWAPLIFAVLYIASSPIPFLAPVLSATGGLLFGTIPGTLYTIVVATASALVPFTIARRLGREWVESKFRGRKWGEIYEQSAGNRGFVFVLLMRLIPVLPWEIQNYVGGLTKVPVGKFIFATMLGTTPGTFSLAFLGSAIADPTTWQLWAALALNAVLALIPIVVVYVRNRRAKHDSDRSPAE